MRDNVSILVDCTLAEKLQLALRYLWRGPQTKEFRIRVYNHCQETTLEKKVADDRHATDEQYRWTLESAEFAYAGNFPLKKWFRPMVQLWRQYEQAK